MTNVSRLPSEKRGVRRGLNRASRNAHTCVFEQRSGDMHAREEACAARETLRLDTSFSMARDLSRGAQPVPEEVQPFRLHLKHQ